MSWCPRCHYGSETCVLKQGEPCPQCGNKLDTVQGKSPHAQAVSVMELEERSRRKRRVKKATMPVAGVEP